MAEAAPATSGGSPGASSNQGGSTKDGGSQGAGGTKEGAGAFDYQSAFKSQQKKIQEQDQSFSKLHQEWEGKKGDLELVSKLKGVFEPPKGDTKESPVANWEKQLDFYIEQAVEAKNRGQGIPLTANLAISHFKSLIENHQAQEKLHQTIAEMRQQLQEVRDPGHQLNQRAYGNFDTHIKNGLERIYGNDPSTFGSRQAQFRAIGQQVSQALQELQRTNPQRWDMIRRDPKEIEAIANRALRMNLPPKAVQMIEQEQLRNTPMSVGELRQAFKEAASIKNDSERTRVQEKIRQDILALTMGGFRAQAG